MQQVQYVMREAPYNVGELAGWPDHKAAELVARGVARHVKELGPDSPKVIAAQLAAAKAAKHPGAESWDKDRNPDELKRPEGKVRVKMLQVFQQWQPGELATFSADIAANLIVSGAAVKAVDSGVGTVASQPEPEAEATAGNPDKYAAMNAQELRSAVGQLTGSRPATMKAAIDVLRELALWDGD